MNTTLFPQTMEEIALQSNADDTAALASITAAVLPINDIKVAVDKIGTPLTTLAGDIAQIKSQVTLALSDLSGLEDILNTMGSLETTSFAEIVSRLTSLGVSLTQLSGNLTVAQNLILTAVAGVDTKASAIKTKLDSVDITSENTNLAVGVGFTAMAGRFDTVDLNGFSSTDRATLGNLSSRATVISGQISDVSAQVSLVSNVQSSKSDSIHTDTQSLLSQIDTIKRGQNTPYNRETQSLAAISSKLDQILAKLP